MRSHIPEGVGSVTSGLFFPGPARTKHANANSKRSESSDLERDESDMI